MWGGSRQLQVGFLTAPFGESTLDDVVAVARETGALALELAVLEGGIIDPDADADENLRAIELLREGGCDVIALASYYLVSGVGPAEGEHGRRFLAESIRLAERAGVPIVSTIAGFPVDDDRERTIATVLPEALGPAVALAGDAGVKLAFENWYETNLRDLEQWELFFETFPDDHVGLVFDPSHLEWQRIDWEQALRDHASRVFLTHAKDVAYDEERLRRVGVLGTGWWRYVLPGLGVISWERFVELLHELGYDGALSIEHEDSEYEPREGIAVAAGNLHEVLVGS